MTMDQEQRRTIAPEPYPQLRLPDIDHVVGKSVEHGHLQQARAE
jgi:hypothetical protein